MLIKAQLAEADNHSFFKLFIMLDYCKTNWSSPGLKNEANIEVQKNCSSLNGHLRLAPNASHSPKTSQSKNAQL